MTLDTSHDAFQLYFKRRMVVLVQPPSCVRLCDPMECSTTDFPVHHQLPELAQTHAHKLVMPSNHLILCPPFSCCPQSFPASGSFPMSRLLASGGQNIGASASASVIPINIQGSFPWGLTVLISLQSNGLLRVFSTTIQKHQFFSAQLSLWSNSHIHIWLLEKPYLWLDGSLSAK